MMKNDKFKKFISTLTNENQRKAGFSLVETLVGMAVLGVMVVIASGSIRGIATNNKLVQSKQAGTTSNQILQVYLSSLNVCTMSVDKTSVIAAISDPDMEAIPQVLPPAQPPDPADFDLEFNIRGLGLLKGGQTINPNLELILDRVFVDDVKFADRNDLNMPRFIGILKVSGHQAIIDETASAAAGTPTYRAGVKVKDQIVGAISLTFNINKTIADCTMNSRTYNEPPIIPDPPGDDECPVIIDPNTGGLLSSSTTPPCDPPPMPPEPCPLGPPCPVTPPAPICASVAQCAVYDYFMRNGIPNPFNSADAWMASNTNWTGIATSYVGQMSSLAEMNLLSNSYNAGLVQSGLNGANTIDQWVANAVGRDPSGVSMLRTQSGLEVLASMFPNTPGDTVAGGTLFTAASQEMLKEILIVAPDVTMNSALGVDVWVQVTGVANTNDFYSNYKVAAAAAAANPLALQDPNQLAAVNAIKSYIASNPADAMLIAQGTGLWAANTPGGVSSVISFIVGSAAQTGSMSHSVDLALATAQWAGALDFTSGSGSQSVADFIAANSAQALQIANGTVIANDVFGGAAVAQAIMQDPNMSAQIAQDLSAFQASSGWSTTQMQDYVTNNPTTWQADLAAAVAP